MLRLSRTVANEMFLHAFSSETRNKLLMRPVPLKHLYRAKYYPAELFKHEIRLRPFFSDAFIYSIAIICCDEYTMGRQSTSSISPPRDVMRSITNLWPRIVNQPRFIATKGLDIPQWFLITFPFGLSKQKRKRTPSIVSKGNRSTLNILVNVLVTRESIFSFLNQILRTFVSYNSGCFHRIKYSFFH